MNVASFLGRARVPGYDCWDFACEGWRATTGEELGDAEPRRFFRERKRLPGPSSPCLVLMRGQRRKPHVGVFLDGRVLHLRERAEYVPLAFASYGFRRVEFYR